MTSKRVDKIQRVLLFLLGIAGLLFISMYLRSYWIQEGFQATPEPCVSIPPECTQQQIGNKVAFLCKPTQSSDITSATPQYLTASGKDSAKSILDCVPNTSSVCYTDVYSLSNKVSGSLNYVCFDRRGNRVFDDSTGVYRDFNAILDKDPQPEVEQETILGLWASYNSGFQKDYTALSTITGTEADVNKLGFSNIYSELSNLQAVSTTYCGTPTGNMTNVCNTLSNTLVTLNSIKNNSGVNSLSNVSTTLGNSRSTIDYVVHTILEPSYYKSGTMPSTQTLAYESAHGIVY